MSTSHSDRMELQEQTSGLDNAIDLRRVVNVILNWRLEILLCGAVAAVLAVAAALAYSEIVPPNYKANADVVVARLASDVTLDDRIKTTVDGLSNGTTNNSRRAAYIQLASSSSIAKEVAQEVNALLPDEIDYTQLEGMVQVIASTAQDGRTPSDLIRVEVTAPDPELAATIANVWATQYIDRVNEVFSQLPVGVIESLKQELAAAETEYQLSQEAMDEYIASSKIGILNASIKEKNSLLQELQSGKIDIYRTVTEGDRAARMATYLELANAQSNAILQVFREEYQAQLEELDRLYVSKAVAVQQLDAARNLMRHIESGDEGAATTNHLALQSLKYEVFSPTTNLTTIVKSGRHADITINTYLSAPALATEQLTDAEALVSTLERYIEELDQKIIAASQTLLEGGVYQQLESIAGWSAEETGESPSSADQAETIQGTLLNVIIESYQALYETSIAGQLVQENALTSELDPLAQSIEVLDQSIQQLRADLSSEEARMQFITQQRDLNWNTFDTLSNRLAELRIERSAANSEVRIASLAVSNSIPIRFFSIPNLAIIAALFGLTLGVVIALNADFLGYSPFVNAIWRRRKPTA